VIDDNVANWTGVLVRCREKSKELIGHCSLPPNYYSTNLYQKMLNSFRLSFCYCLSFFLVIHFFCLNPAGCYITLYEESKGFLMKGGFTSKCILALGGSHFFFGFFLFPFIPFSWSHCRGSAIFVIVLRSSFRDLDTFTAKPQIMGTSIMVCLRQN